MKKITVITGGTRGIGKALVHIFAKNGFDIITCSRNAGDLDNLKKEVISVHKNASVSIFQADVSKKEEVRAFINYVRSFRKPVDVLINNAGIFLSGQISNEPEGMFEEMMGTNLSGAYHLTRGLVGDMMERRSGHIFNICSTASIKPYINGGSYCISKYALYGMSQVLREELKTYNVKVTAVLPGATLTSSWAEDEVDPNRLMKPEDVASSIWNTWKMSGQTVVEEILLRPQLGDID